MPFTKIGVAVTVFQPSRMSPTGHDLCKMVESCLPMTSASCLGACGCNLSGSMDLGMSPTRSSSTKGKSSLPQTFTHISEAWDSRRPVLPVKSEVKKSEDLKIFMSFVTTSSASFSSGPTFSLVFFCCSCTCEILEPGRN